MAMRGRPPSRALDAYRIDETDFAILRELLAGSTDSFRSDRVQVHSIASKLQLHRNTVTSRIRRLTEARVFLPLTLELDPGQVGMVGARVFFEGPREGRSTAARDAILDIDGVFGILTFHEGWEVVVYGENTSDLREKLENIRIILGATRSEVELDTARDYAPEENVELSSLDARIIAALLRDARMSFGRIGRDLGITPRTAERRFERLRRSGVVTMLPGSPARLSGMMMAEVRADVRGGKLDQAETAQRVLELMPNHFVRNVATKGRIHLFLFGRSIEGLGEQFDALRLMEGVGNTNFRIFLGPLPSPRYRDWLASWLERYSSGGGRPPSRTSLGRRPETSGVDPSLSRTAVRKSSCPRRRLIR